MSQNDEFYFGTPFFFKLFAFFDGKTVGKAPTASISFYMMEKITDGKE